MARFDITCRCRKVLGTLELPEGADVRRALSGYVCESCGHADLGIERRWMEFDDVVLDGTTNLPLGIVRVVMREPFRELRPGSTDVVTLVLLEDDLRPSAAPLSGNARRSMSAGSVQFDGLYVRFPGRYCLRADSPGLSSAVSNHFEVR